MVHGRGGGFTGDIGAVLGMGMESMDGMAWHGNGDFQRHGTSITPTTTTNAHGCLWIIAANNHDNVEVNKELN
jgi:hypothetical protein